MESPKCNAMQKYLKLIERQTNLFHKKIIIHQFYKLYSRKLYLMNLQKANI
jgi:hypothetical protein